MREVHAVVWAAHHTCVLLTLGDVLAGADGWEQVDHEGEDVAGEDEGDGPLEDGTHVFLVGTLALGTDAESDGQTDFNNGKGDLDEETGEKHAMLAAVGDDEAEVLGTDEDCADNVATTRYGRRRFAVSSSWVWGVGKSE